MDSICLTVDCKNKKSTTDLHEGSEPRNYCDKCYEEDQEEVDCECGRNIHKGLVKGQMRCKYCDIDGDNYNGGLTSDEEEEEAIQIYEHKGIVMALVCPDEENYYIVIDTNNADADPTVSLDRKFYKKSDAEEYYREILDEEEEEDPIKCDKCNNNTYRSHQENPDTWQYNYWAYCKDCQKEMN